MLILPDETHAPRFDAAAAAALVAEHWGMAVTAADELGSYQDQVFRIEAPGGERYALKLANTEVARAVLEAEHLVLGALAGQLGPSPSPPVCAGHRRQRARAHRRPPRAPPDVGTRTPLADGGFVDHERARALGDVAARISAALTDLDHPGAHRPFQWDVRQAANVVELSREHLTDDEWVMQQRALTWLAGVDDAALPRQLAYTDVTANNLLGTLGADGTFTPTALVDFGDLVHTWRLADPVGGRVLVDRGRPGAGTHAGDHDGARLPRHQPLTEAEADAFWPVPRAAPPFAPPRAPGRYAVRSPCRRRRAPTSRRSSRATMRRCGAILAVDPVVGRAATRAACGLAPPPGIAGGSERLAALRQATLLDGVEPEDLVPIDLGPHRRCSPRAGGTIRPRSPAPCGNGCGAPTRAAPCSSGAGGGAAHRRRPPERRRSRIPAPRCRPLHARRHAGARAFAARVIAAEEGVVELESPTAVRAPLLRLAGLTPGVRAGDVVEPGARIGTVRAADEGDLLPPHPACAARGGPGLPASVDPELAEVWLALCPDPSEILVAGVGGLAAAPAEPAAEQRRRRDATVARPQHLYYREPAQIVRGWRQYLFDASGRRTSTWSTTSRRSRTPIPR